MRTLKPLEKCSRCKNDLHGICESKMDCDCECTIPTVQNNGNDQFSKSKSLIDFCKRSSFLTLYFLILFGVGDFEKYFLFLKIFADFDKN